MNVGVRACLRVRACAGAWMLGIRLKGFGRFGTSDGRFVQRRPEHFLFSMNVGVRAGLCVCVRARADAWDQTFQVFGRFGTSDGRFVQRRPELFLFL